MEATHLEAATIHGDLAVWPHLYGVCRVSLWGSVIPVLGNTLYLGTWTLMVAREINKNEIGPTTTTPKS